MKARSEWTIPITGIKQGMHHFRFELKDKFFEAFEYSEIQRGDVEVNVDVEKQSTMMVLDFHLRGNVMVMCDRCGDEIEQHLESDNRLIVKFGEETGSTDFDVYVLGPAEYEVDLAQFMYEYAHLALPARRVHTSIEQCNQDVLNAIEKYRVTRSAGEEWTDADEDQDNEEEE
jgi:uncharacterized metal-binding protein YceD (DUF177 family)